MKDGVSYVAAGSGKTKRRTKMKYKSLMGVILSKENLLRAYKRVVSNGGAPGVDGVRVEELKALLQQHWADIQLELLEGIYHPAQVKGVEIPKASGGKGLLGIPTVLDRFIQQAIQQVLGRLWDVDFSPYSYGFRPGRNAQQALLQAME